METNALLPSFSLPGTDRATHSTDDFASKNAVVIIFTCNHCPYARAYLERIAQLADNYEKRNVGIYAISSNDAAQYPEDKFENMIDMDRYLRLRGKYLYDETQEVARMFGAQRTPEVFVFNKERKLIYDGLIDDNANYKEQRAIRHTYLRDAIEAALNNTIPAIQKTQAIGCTIKWKPSSVSSS